MKHLFPLSLILLALATWIYTEADAQQADTTPPTVTILPMIEDNHRKFFPNYTDEQIRAKGLTYDARRFKVMIVFSEELRSRKSFAWSELKITGTARSRITEWDSTVSNGRSEYTVTILPESGGTVTFNVAANVVRDKALNLNKDPAKEVTVRIDTSPPVASITVPPGTQNGPFDVTVTFNEPVAVAERFLTPNRNGQTNFIGYADGYEGRTTTEKWTIDASRRIYTTTFTPDTDRTRALKLYLVADRAFDAVGNTTVENRVKPTLVPIDTTRPQIVSAELLPDSPADTFKLKVTFSEPVFGLEKSEILVEKPETLMDEEPDVTITDVKPVLGRRDYIVTGTVVTAQQIELKIGIGVARDAANNGNKPAAIMMNLEDDSDDNGTVDDSDDNGAVTVTTLNEPRPFFPPTPVAQNRVIFNEIRNTEEDENDWIELKNISDKRVALKNWEISIVNSNGQNANTDMDVVSFPNYTLPPGQVLLITNTDSGDTQLIPGQDITNPNSNPNRPPQQLVAPKMILPNTPYLLILRSATDKNGAPEAFEDIVGNYFRFSANYSTWVWPLRNTFPPRSRATEALTQGQAWRRIDPKERGYSNEAWAPSGYQSGIGYKVGTPLAASLGTPGYPNDTVPDDSFAGRIIFSELMFATKGGLFSQPQWIELYDNTMIASEAVNLEGWKLVIEARDSETRHRYSVIELQALHIAPTQTVLLVTRNRKRSEYLSEDQIYDLYQRHRGAFELGLRENAVIPASGFALKLFAPDGTLVDTAGNLDGEEGIDTPTWTLPSGRTEDGARTSLVRRYRNGVALTGTEATSWERATDIQLPISGYYGHKTDIGTPGYKNGGPAPVMLSHFSANRTDAGVILTWITQSELDNAGFNILRSQTPQGPFIKLNPTLISGAGTTAEPRTYTWTDTTTKPNVIYYYRIEDISLSGDKQHLATVHLRGNITASDKHLKKWSEIKAPQ